MSWFAEKFEKFRKLPTRLLMLHVTSKFLFGVGLGALLASYLKGLDWQICGWSLIILSLIIAIPSTYRILKK
jgi:hypothetical protein